MRYTPELTRFTQNVDQPDGEQKSTLFATAAILARKGQYQDALSVLKQAREVGECSQTEALDLQAKIYAQQGMYLDAEKCWVEASSLDRSNPSYPQALVRLIQMRQPWSQRVTTIIIIGALFTLALLLVVQNTDVRDGQNAIKGDIASLDAELDQQLANTVNRVQFATLQADVQSLQQQTRDLTEMTRQVQEQMRVGTETTNSLRDAQNAMNREIVSLNVANNRQFSLLQELSDKQDAMSREMASFKKLFDQRLANLATNGQLSSLQVEFQLLQQQVHDLTEMTRQVQEQMRVGAETTNGNDEQMSPDEEPPQPNLQ